MKQKERHAIYELIGLGLSGFALAFVLPTLLSAHEDIALMLSGMLAVAWMGWVAFFLIRLNSKGY